MENPLYLIAILILLGQPAPALASESVNSALAAQAAARAQYYDQYREAVDRGTPPDSNALAKRILSGANASVEETLHRETLQTLRRNVSLITDRGPAGPIPDVVANSSLGTEVMAGDGTTGGGNLSGGSGAGGGSQSSSTRTRSGQRTYILDGSKVPKELDFSEKKQ